MQNIIKVLSIVAAFMAEKNGQDVWVLRCTRCNDFFWVVASETTAKVSHCPRPNSCASWCTDPHCVGECRIEVEFEDRIEMTLRSGTVFTLWKLN